MSDIPKSVKVCFTTLGCPKNEADTDHMVAAVRNAGYTIVKEPADADIAVINTCSFLTAATEESLDTIFDIVSSNEEREMRLKIIVSGCLPSRYGTGLEEELHEADAFITCGEENGIVETIATLSGVKPYDGYLPSSTSRTPSNPCAYLKISDGCSRCCSFCAIPYIKGPYHSRNYDEIVVEADELASGGAKEIVLVGQDTGIWGCDLQNEGDLPSLIGRLAEHLPGIWFRVLYIQPEGVTNELLETMKAHDNICNYLDIPLQHVSSHVLGDMNRSGDATTFQSILKHIRTYIPDIRIRSTFICGFPGETEEDFDELCEFVSNAGLDYAGVFPYSQEDGTPAGMRDDQIPLQIRIRRANELREICERTGFSKTASHVGTTGEVLIDSCENTDVGIESIGRTMGQAPEVDGTVHIQGLELECGSKHTVRLVDSFCYEYEGELVD